MVFDDLDPGDETRRNGDYISLPHGAAEDGSGGPSEGDVVAMDTNGELTAVNNNDGAGALEEADVVGVLYTYQYYGEPSTIRTDRDATVKTHGAVKANIGDYDDVSTGYSQGDVAGANGELLLLTDVDADGYAEVLVR